MVKEIEAQRDSLSQNHRELWEPAPMSQLGYLCKGMIEKQQIKETETQDRCRRTGKSMPFITSNSPEFN